MRRAFLSGQAGWGWGAPVHARSPRPARCSPQPLETPAPPAHRPPEDDGEEDDGEDEDWEDVSEEEIEEEEEEEEEPTQDHPPQEAEPTGSPTGEQADKEPSRPEEPLPLPQAPATPSSPFSPPGGHQPVSDWGEEMELNSPRNAHPADALPLSPGEAWPFGNA